MSLEDSNILPISPPAAMKAAAVIGIEPINCHPNIIKKKDNKYLHQSFLPLYACCIKFIICFLMISKIVKTMHFKILNSSNQKIESIIDRSQ